MTLRFSEFLTEGPVQTYRVHGGGRGGVTKKQRFWACPAGHKRKSLGPGKPPKCLPKGVPTLTGAAKIRKKFAIKKKIRTQKSKGAGYKAKIGLKVRQALKYRKKMGIRTPGR